MGTLAEAEALVSSFTTFSINHIKHAEQKPIMILISSSLVILQVSFSNWSYYSCHLQYVGQVDYGQDLGVGAINDSTKTN